MGVKGWKSQGLIYDNRICIAETANSQIYIAEMRTSHSKVKKKVILKVFKQEHLAKDYLDHLGPVIELESPNCSSIFHFDTYKSRPLVVMEFIDGLTLAELYRRSQLSEKECCEIYHQAVMGLLDLQQAGLFHGDLSPSNIMIDKFGRVKLIDFGLGHLIFVQPQTTLEFASKHVLNGEIPNYKSDLESLKNIFSQIFDFMPAAQCNSVESDSKLVCDFETQQILSLKVRALLEQKKAVHAVTRGLVLKQKLKSQLKLVPILASVLLSLAMGHVPSELRMDRFNVAFISVFTQKWLQIAVDNNTELGYTPLHRVQLSKGKHTLYWKSYGSQGQVTLTLKSGEHRVLDDQFFK